MEESPCAYANPVKAKRDLHVVVEHGDAMTNLLVTLSPFSDLAALTLGQRATRVEHNGQWFAILLFDVSLVFLLVRSQNTC